MGAHDDRLFVFADGSTRLSAVTLPLPQHVLECPDAEDCFKLMHDIHKEYSLNFRKSPAEPNGVQRRFMKLAALPPARSFH